MNIEERYSYHPDHVRTMSSNDLRKAFLVESLMSRDKVTAVYSHFDRMVIGGVVPGGTPLTLTTPDAFKSKFFLERREIGIINIGGEGSVTVDGTRYNMNKLDCVYAGKGGKELVFESNDTGSPAKFYFLSSPAHHIYPTVMMTNKSSAPLQLGSRETSNERTIYKYIHEDGIKSCQLVMGLTILKEGNVWNTMPPHTHNRRMEAYLYFDMDTEHRVFHMMGEANETRHMLVANEQAIISPPWSIHSGCGTSSYSFIWGMAGENQAFTDMDAIAIENLK